MEWEVTQPLWFPLQGEGGMNLKMPPSPSVPWPLLSAFRGAGGDVPVRRGGGCPGARGRLALRFCCQRRKKPWYPAVFTASAHVLSVSMKATSRANLRLSPSSVCSFCMTPGCRLTEKPPHRSAQTVSPLQATQHLAPLRTAPVFRFWCNRVAPNWKS